MSKYTMRNLKTKDLYKMSKILKKLEIKLENERNMSEKQFGMAMIKLAFENLHMAETEVNEFLSELVGLTVEAFEELDFEDTQDILAQFKNQKGLKGFLKSAAK